MKKITDKARLDYLTHGGSWGIEFLPNRIGKDWAWRIIRGTTKRSHPGKTPRQSIDAAIRSERGG